MKYNYQPLISQVSSADIMSLKRKYDEGKYYWTYLKSNPAAAILVLLSIITFLAIGLLARRWLFSSLEILIMIVIAGVLLLFSVNQRQKIWTERVRLSRFAEANQLSYIPSLPNAGYSGMIFNIGRDRQAYNLLRSDLIDNKFEIANLRYTVGSGKSTRTVKKGYLMIQLDRNLPHMVLDSRFNNTELFGVSLSNLPVVFQKNQKLSLEGDFDSYFTLYAPKEYKRDALYVFAPDLMALFIDQTGYYDAEIIDNNLYIYSTNEFDLLDGTLLSRLFNIIETVGAKTITQTDRYSDERAGDVTSNIVSSDGRRLKSRASRLVIILIIIYLAVQTLPRLVQFLLG